MNMVSYALNKAWLCDSYRHSLVFYRNVNTKYNFRSDKLPKNADMKIHLRKIIVNV